MPKDQINQLYLMEDGTRSQQIRSRKICQPCLHIPIAYLLISAVLRIDIRMKEKKKRESPDFCGFKY